jgi:hypothetical protein
VTGLVVVQTGNCFRVFNSMPRLVFGGILGGSVGTLGRLGIILSNGIDRGNIVDAFDFALTVNKYIMQMIKLNPAQLS